MLKITLKGKKIDTAGYDTVAAEQLGTAMLLCYSYTEMQTDGCSHSIKSDGLHYDRVNCICSSSLVTPNMFHQPLCYPFYKTSLFAITSTC